MLNARVNRKDKIMHDQTVRAKIEEVQSHLGEDGRILVRPSERSP
jgi:hypothetical protein